MKDLYDENEDLELYEDDIYGYDSYDDGDNEDIQEGDRKARRYKLDSEYDEEYYSDEEEENKRYRGKQEEDEIEEDIDISLYDEDYIKELEEMEEDFDEEKPKKKKKKVSKDEPRDMSGVAVKERFYEIMKDYHSGNEQKRSDALGRAMKELEGFIHVIIKRSYSTYSKKYFLDLLQEGYLGVAVGMEKYNPDLSMPSTFFYPYIKHEMQGFITRNVDKTTAHYSANIKKINKAIQELEEKGIRYTNVDIALQTGMTIETVDQSMAIRKYRDEVHIDACPPNVIDGEVEENKHKTPEQEFIEKEMTSIVYRTINTLLSEDEITVLQYHFGINDTKRCSEGETARRMGVPKDKVKRLLNRAIRKLRQSELAHLFGDNLAVEDRFLEDVNISLIPRDASESDIEFLSQIDSIIDDE